MKAAPVSVDDYIAAQPTQARAQLKRLRAAIRACAPGATQKISYGIPTFHLHRNLVHFAVFRGHVGFYPGASAITRFQRELAKYDTAQGTVRFALDAPLPLALALVARMVGFRVRENLAAKRP
jgi:uncharacterized protein YdhG (YjbR/CyaY superfamily)